MKFFIAIISACCLLITAILFIGEHIADSTRAQTADSRSERPITYQSTPPSSRSWLGSRSGVQQIIERMDLVLSEAIELDTESSGALDAASTASIRLRDELFVDFRRAGGTSQELLEWLSGVTARGGKNDHLLERIVHDTVLEVSSTPGRAALVWLLSQPDSDFITKYLFEQATRSWLHEDQKQALGWLDRNMNRFEGHGVRFVVLDWPQDDVAGAREWVETRMAAEGDSFDPSLVSDVARMWASQDSTEAFDWIFSLDDRWHDWSFLGIAQGAPDENLPALADWLRDNREVGRELDRIRSTVARRIAGSDPFTAIEVAADITNLAESDEVIITAARNLYIADPELVLAWLPESGLTEAAQHDILSGESD